MIKADAVSEQQRVAIFGESEKKNLSVEGLRELREKFKDKKIVLCHGAFDLVHLGHLIHFRQAKSFGDILVITLTADSYITKKRKISFTQEDRASQLAALEVVDYVCIIHENSAVTSIKELRPDFYVKGSEYKDLTLDKTKNIFREKEIIEAQGGQLVFTGGQTFSSTKLSHFLQASPEAEQANPLLRNEGIKFKDISNQNIPLEMVKDFIIQASKMKVCVIGETIIDEWIDVSLSNVSMKSKCVTGHEVSRMSQVGGAGIVALHLSNFVKSVDFFSNDYPETPPQNMRIFPLSNSELVKRRYVDMGTNFTLFESKKLDLKVFGRSELPCFDDYDLVVIADFGHGLINADIVNELIKNSKKTFVAAMAQVNSSNFGFNLPKKYKGAHFYSVNKTEAELSLNKRDLSEELLCKELFELLNPKKGLAVTAGDRGAILLTEDGVFRMESLSEIVKDTIGCGDAFLAFSSLALACGASEKISLLAGNIGAAAMAQKRCNESAVNESEFMTIAKIVI